jgi:hypothetical protein
MNPTRFQLLRANVALLLGQARPLLYPESRLAADLQVIVRPTPTQSEFEHVIGRMERAGQVVRHRTEDEGVKTKLTEVGEAELLQ